VYVRAGEQWIPDGLVPVALPYEGRLGNPEVPDQTAQAFWLDLSVDRSSPVRRIKVEPQVYIDGDWIRYPMEARLSAVVLGSGEQAPTSGDPDVTRPSASSALRVWRTMLCGSSEKNKGGDALSIRDFIARNVGQDVRFAGGAPPAALLRAVGVADRAAFCRGSTDLRRPEDYLAVRDALVGTRE
jgi:hypothetical protein